MSNEKTSTTNWETFLQAFTSKVPQLLVHVYEKFRNETMDDKPKYYHVQEKNRWDEENYDDKKNFLSKLLVPYGKGLACSA